MRRKGGGVRFVPPARKAPPPRARARRGRGRSGAGEKKQRRHLPSPPIGLTLASFTMMAAE